MSNKSFRPANIVALVFAILGTVFLIVGLAFLANHMSFTSSAEETVGVISDISMYGNDRIYVDYEVDGVKYTSPLDYYSSSMWIGQEITILYKVDNPGAIRSSGMLVITWVFGGMGLLFLVVALVVFCVSRALRNRKEALRTYGTQVDAAITGVERNTAVRVSGRCPFYVTCNWTDPTSGTTYIFRSDNLWYDPAPMITERGITTLPVFIDPHNIKQYLVALEAIDENVVVL